MKFDKYISKEGLYGELTNKQRKDRSDTIVERLNVWTNTGMSRKEMLKRALCGVSKDGMPDYRHRSYVADVAPVSLQEAPVFEFTNKLSKREGQKVIDDYLRRYPKPQRWEEEERE